MLCGERTCAKSFASVREKGHPLVPNLLGHSTYQQWNRTSSETEQKDRALAGCGMYLGIHIVRLTRLQGCAPRFASAT